MRLIHCADIHMDSALGTHLTPDKAAARRSEIYHTFSRMTAYARENNVRAMLIAGDLFDARRVTRKAAAFVLDTVKSNPQMDFYLLRGNHDGGHRAFDGMELPENLHCFSDAFTAFRLENVCIGGAEDLSDPAVYGQTDFPADTFNILLMHGSVGSTAGADNVCLPQLQNRRIDYLALGHYHSFRSEQLDDRGIWAYSGCPEGRGFDECGTKGFILLDTDTRRLQFVPIAQRQIREIPVDITGCTTVHQIKEAVVRGVEGIPSQDMIRVILEGRYTVETEKDIPYIKQVLEGRFYFSDVKDESRLHIDPSAYKNDISLKGEFVRTVMASRSMSAEEKERVLACGIRALLGEEVQL